MNRSHLDCPTLKQEIQKHNPRKESLLCYTIDWTKSKLIVFAASLLEALVPIEIEENRAMRHPHALLFLGITLKSPTP